MRRYISNVILIALVVSITAAPTPAPAPAPINQHAASSRPPAVTVQQVITLEPLPATSTLSADPTTVPQADTANPPAPTLPSAPDPAASFTSSSSSSGGLPKGVIQTDSFSSTIPPATPVADQNMISPTHSVSAPSSTMLDSEKLNSLMPGLTPTGGLYSALPSGMNGADRKSLYNATVTGRVIVSRTTPAILMPFIGATPTPILPPSPPSPPSVDNAEKSQGDPETPDNILGSAGSTNRTGSANSSSPSLPCVPGAIFCNSATQFSMCVSVTQDTTKYTDMGPVAAGTLCQASRSRGSDAHTDAIVLAHDKTCPPGKKDGDIVCNNGVQLFWMCTYG